MSYRCRACGATYGDPFDACGHIDAHDWPDGLPFGEMFEHPEGSRG